MWATESRSFGNMLLLSGGCMVSGLCECDCDDMTDQGQSKRTGNPRQTKVKKTGVNLIAQRAQRKQPQKICFFLSPLKLRGDIRNA
ncbi:hypothetical protein QBC36DRAFT_319672 [Triangularia setosa]|uniref:Secreted protein n=1 Tax=Triangularia setosa TaxID=2587417 RepID=A0AAN6WHY3_9PEZI|nr:hypothetical protein QBC36DRAFT_319672 [Podospora setosa]